MKHVSTFANETKEVVGNPKSKVDFYSASKDEGNKELMDKPFTLYEVKNITKKKKLNVYEHFSTMDKHNTTMLQYPYLKLYKIPMCFVF
jgi:hypothetical protein